MISNPSADELLAAAAQFLEGVAPKLKDRDVFLARVAVNALGLVRREMALGEAARSAARARMAALLGDEGDWDALNAKLCRAIQDGAFDADDRALRAHLRLSLIDQLRIDQPGYAGLKEAQNPLSAPHEPGSG